MVTLASLLIIFQCREYKECADTFTTIDGALFLSDLLQSDILRITLQYKSVLHNTTKRKEKKTEQ